MIYYYSATGNTRYAARYLAESLREEAFDILEREKELPFPEDENEPIGIMFPIYCWGIPPVVSQFLEEKLYPKIAEGRYLWAACTCGDETGTAMRQLDRHMRRLTGREADALWSVIMPNTYVLLPGFDVDSKKTEEAKLGEAPGRLDHIAGKIRLRESGIRDVTEGTVPGLRSAVFPLFRKWGVNTRWWHVSALCIGCGRCSAICPARNIAMKDGRPEWGKRCFSCCACYHCCPVKAISYARFTKDKSQYLCPI